MEYVLPWHLQGSVRSSAWAQPLRLGCLRCFGEALRACHAHTVMHACRQPTLLLLLPTPLEQGGKTTVGELEAASVTSKHIRGIALIRLEVS